MVERPARLPVEGGVPRPDALLATKLHVPRPPPGFVPRPRLATFLVEGTLWLGALAWYVRATRPRGRIGALAFWVMIVLLTTLWLISLNGDPPPSLYALAVVNSVLFAIVETWAFWVRNRRVQS